MSLFPKPCRKELQQTGLFAITFPIHSQNKGIFLMKIIMNAMLLLAFSLAPIAAFAADAGPTKGTKSYQATKSNTPDGQTETQDIRAENTQKPQDIAPAAGANEERMEPQGKSFKEDIRLPRKN